MSTRGVYGFRKDGVDKKQAFLDRFIKNWCCSADNHPEGWAWWKKFNRKQTREAYKRELRKEINSSE